MLTLPSPIKKIYWPNQSPCGWEFGEEKKDYYVTGAQDEGLWVKLTDMDMGINYHIAEMKKKFK